MAHQNSKLGIIIENHKLVKISFQQLKSQIKFGLLEAEDVFASLSLPLMKLVGLKTEEMAREGRFSTIVMDSSDSCVTECRTNGFRSQTLGRSSYAVNGDDQIHRAHQLEDISHATKAIRVGKIFREKQELQLKQLVQLLRQIETQVNTSQGDIMETLRFHRTSLNKFFRKATSYISNSNQRNHNRDAFNSTLELLHITFEQVDAAFGAVESGVDGLIQGLSEQMCYPMVKYVKCVKADMTTGTCQHLMSMVEEMGVVMRDGRYELGEARKKWRAAEEQKVEALRRLREAEERMKRMKEYLRSLETKKSSATPVVLHQDDEEEKKGEKLNWELLKKKGKRRIPESPLGGEGISPNSDPNKKVLISPSTGQISLRPRTRSFTSAQILNPKTPCSNTLSSLGFSPSANSTYQLRKRINP